MIAHDSELPRNLVTPFAGGETDGNQLRLWFGSGHYFRDCRLLGLLQRQLGSGGATAGADEYLVIDGTDTVGGLVECELSHISMLKSYALKS